jgi:hypothetical protein
MGTKSKAQDGRGSGRIIPSGEASAEISGEISAEISREISERPQVNRPSAPPLPNMRKPSRNRKRSK